MNDHVSQCTNVSKQSILTVLACAEAWFIAPFSILILLSSKALIKAT